ncbi:hypothetical protein [Pelomonas sp. KK5]|uniref:hypothetical protein n=1 Tax=Pelomonas sp. KK5 TaxID=1855730 RepID=UPI0009F86188|nr:hypothetical protein [Pelomonas sp. KK5]
MKLKKTLALAAFGAAALVLGVSPDGEVGFTQAQAQAESVRPEVGKHLKDAQTLYKAGKYKEALGKVRDAEGVAGRTAAENNAIEGMRVAAASGAGDTEQMVKGFEALSASGRLGGADKLRMEESIAGTYLRNKDNAKALAWAQRYFKDGGTSPSMKQVLTSAQYLSGDMTAVIRDTQEEIAADEKAGRTPSKDKLNLLLGAAQKKGDSAAEGVAMEKLLNYYPSKELWGQVLGSLPQKKSFSDRFTLDLYRLKLATGNMKDANDYMEMAQLAAQAGYPDEGKTVVEKGVAAGVLGQGAEGARHKRLADLMAKKIGEAKAGQAEAEKLANDSRSGDQLVQLGLASAFRGDAAKGAKMIQAGIDKDQLKRPDDAKLYLGLALYMAGDVSKAQAAWRGVKGSDGATDIARIWIVQSRSKK